MIDFLSYLDLRLPQVRSVSSFAIIALKVLDDELHNEGLLKQGSLNNFFLNCNFYFKPSGVWFSIDKTCIYHFDSFQTFDMLEAKG